MKTRKHFYVSCLLAAALGLGLAPNVARAQSSPTQAQLEAQLKQVLAQGATAAANGGVQGIAGQLNNIAQSEKTGDPLHDAALGAAQAGISLISQIMQMLLDKVLNGTATPADLAQLGNLQNQSDNLNNGNFGTPPPPPGTPGTGTPGSGLPGSGLPGTGTPGSGLPGSGLPGSGLPGSGLPGSGLPGSGLPGSGTTGSLDPYGNPIGSSGIDPSGTGAVTGGADPYGTGSGANGSGVNGAPGGISPTGGGYGGGYGGGSGGGSGGDTGGGSGGSSGTGGVGGSTGGAGGAGGAGGKSGGSTPKIERVKGRLLILPRTNKKPLNKLFQTDLDGRVAGSIKAADADKLQKLFAKVKKGDEIGDSLARVEFTVAGWRQAAKSGLRTPTAQQDDDELGEGPNIRGKDGKIDLTRCDAWIVADWQTGPPKRYMVHFKDSSLDFAPGATLLVRGAVGPLSAVPQELKADFPGEISTLDALDVALAPPESAATTTPTPTETPATTTPGKFSGNGSAAPNNRPASPGTSPGKGQKPAAGDEDEFKED